MTTMQERESAFENKFAHDAELKFRVEARRTKLAGAWAAGVMGLDPEQTKAYIQSLVATDMTEAGSDDVLRKLTQDFQAKGHDPMTLQIGKKLEEFLQIAKNQIMAE